MKYESFDKAAAAQQGTGYDKSYLDLPKVSFADVTLLWAEDYYDGHLSGKCLVGGRMHHFRMVDEGVLVWDEIAGKRDATRSDPWWRRFELVPMTDEQVAEAERRHELFRRHVGDNYDYREGIAPATPTGQHHLFYDEAKTWEAPAFEKAPASAWFEE